MPRKRQTGEAASTKDFWQGKVSCWELTCCPEPIHKECPAYRYRQYPCWEIEGTYCKWDKRESLGRDTSPCLICNVYLSYGKGQSIKLKLWGQGIKVRINP